MRTDKWHKRFLRLAKEVSTWSKDPSTQVGTIIVDQDNKIVSVGYNGFPKGLEDTDERLNDRTTKYGMIIHGEMNALLNSTKSVKGCTLYNWPFISCERCAVHIIQAGIDTIVSPPIPAHLQERWSDSITKTIAYFKEANINVIECEIDANLD